jgi:hypothetical protein
MFVDFLLFVESNKGMIQMNEWMEKCKWINKSWNA